MPDDGYDALLNDDDAFAPSAFPKAGAEHRTVPPWIIHGGM